MKTFRLSALSLCVLCSCAFMSASVAAPVAGPADIGPALELDGDPGPRPVVTVEVIAPETREIPPWLDQPVIPAVFRISRTHTNGALAVSLRLGGTARNGVDYDFSPSAIIEAGSRSTEVYIFAHDDDLVEGTESVVLTLLPGPCLQCYAVGEPATATAYILDDDTTNTPPTIFFYAPAAGETFTVPADIVLRASADDREDPHPITVEFFEGANRIGQGTFIPTLCPSPFCPFYALTWSNVAPGRYSLTARATDRAGLVTVSDPVRITVVGIDPPPEQTVVSVTAVDPQASEPGIPAVVDDGRFAFRRRGNLQAAIPVHFTVAGTALNGVDCTFITNRVVIPAGATQAVVNVHALADHLIEGTETVVLTLEPIVCIEIFPQPPECYAIESGQATVFINDGDGRPANEAPVVTLHFPQEGEVFTAPADIVLRAAAQDAEDGFQIRVEFFAGTNRIGVGTFLPTLCPAPWCPSFDFTWSNVPPGRYTLTAKAADQAGVMTVSAPVHITVAGEASPPVVRIEATGRIAEESSEPFRRLNLVGEFTISHNGPTDAAVPVFVHYSGSATPVEDYVRLPWLVTIPAGSRSTQIRVEPADDRIAEGIETLVATLSECPPNTEPALGIPCYLTPIDPARDRATVFVRDDGITEASLAITKPADGASFRAGEMILIEATAIDLEGYISRVEFWDGAQSIGVSEIFFIQAPEAGTPIYHSFAWRGSASGSHVLTARGARPDGTAVQSQPVTTHLGAANPDTDADGVPDEADLCRGTPAGASVDAQGCSAGQRDSDQDGDGVSNDADNCPNTPAGAIVNAQGCSIAQLAPCDGSWRHHRHRVNAVRRAAFAFRQAGLITRQTRQEMIREAVRSDCGRRQPG